MSRLIHLNGAPGVGKSSLASRYLDDHPLALLLDIDAIRTALGQWRDREESKLVARELALALAGAHLRNGYDVIVPQYLGHPEFIMALERAAERNGAGFVEVIVDADHAIAVDRFRSRRAQLLADGEAHPEADVLDGDVESTISAARANLARVLSERQFIAIEADRGVDETYDNLIAALEKRAE